MLARVLPNIHQAPGPPHTQPTLNRPLAGYPGGAPGGYPAYPPPGGYPPPGQYPQGYPQQGYQQGYGAPPQTVVVQQGGKPGADGCCTAW